MIDSHCHLNFESFNDCHSQIAEDARIAGVHSIIVVGTDLASSRRAIELAETYNGVFAVVSFGESKCALPE